MRLRTCMFTMLSVLAVNGCASPPAPAAVSGSGPAKSLHPKLLEIVAHPAEGLRCGAPSVCGDLVKIDCGAAYDGPLTYYDNRDGSTVAQCGGFRMAGGENCPPRQWTCVEGGADGFEAQLRAQADAWDAAIVRKDREAIADNMSDSFLQIGSDGALADKAKFIEGITSDKLVIAPYRVEEFRVRVYGDTALITGRTDMHGSWDGKPFESHYRFTDTYVREPDGRWRVVNVQTTEVAQH